MISTHKPMFKNQLDHIDTKEINLRYELEGQMMSAISFGNFDEYMRMTLHPRSFDVRVERLKSDKLRDRKNAMIIRKTLMRIAARNGGVPPIYLHILTEKYAIIIEQARTIDYLDNILANEMAKAFCDAVSQFSIKNYSLLIKEAVLFIDSNLSEKLNVKTIAEAIGIHPTYLSRRFKKETQQNLTDYVNQQRVQYAIHQFTIGDTDITNVALNCGYSSSSYFSKIFKKVSTLTPSQFIKERI